MASDKRLKKKRKRLFVCWVDIQFKTWTVIIYHQQPKTKSHLYWTKETIDSAADRHWPGALGNLKANVPTTYSVIIYFFDLLQSMQLFFSMFNHQLEKLFFISKNKRHPSHSYPQKTIKKKTTRKNNPKSLAMVYFTRRTELQSVKFLIKISQHHNKVNWVNANNTTKQSPHLMLYNPSTVTS